MLEQAHELMSLAGDGVDEPGRLNISYSRAL